MLLVRPPLVNAAAPTTRCNPEPQILWPTYPGYGDSGGSDSGAFPSLTAIKAREAACPPEALTAFVGAAAVRHLAIRRAKWLSGAPASNGVALNAEAKPTLADFIRALSGDTENLLALTYVARQNGVEGSALAAAFKAADVDITAEVAIADKLLAISPRAIGLNEAQLGAARDVLWDAPGAKPILR